MTKTWLMRRAVRRPVAPDVTARISSSVCRLPFIRSSPLAFADQRDALGGRVVAVRGVDDLVAADVDLVLGRGGGDLGARPDQDRHDDPELGGLDRPAQRGLVAGMDHDGLGGRHLLGAGDQPIVFRMRAVWATLS